MLQTLDPISHVANPKLVVVVIKVCGTVSIMNSLMCLKVVLQ
jgi:hypothetical protein